MSKTAFAEISLEQHDIQFGKQHIEHQLDSASVLYSTMRFSRSSMRIYNNKQKHADLWFA